MKHRLNKMPVVIRSKATIWQPTDLVASPGDVEVNRTRTVVESPQGNAVVAGHEEVRILSPTCADINGSQCSQDLVSLNIKIKDSLHVLYISLNINLSPT